MHRHRIAAARPRPLVLAATGRLIAAAFVLGVLLTSPAHAGTYEHLTVSPLSAGRDGWSPAVASPGGHVATGADHFGLWAGFFNRDAFDPGDLAEWSYAAPPGTVITAWEFDRTVAGIGPGDWNTLFYAFTDDRWALMAADVPSVNVPGGRLHIGGLAASRVIARLICGGPHWCHRGAAGTTLHIRAIRVVLHDQHAPAVGVVQGDLMRNDVLSGVERLSFSASDTGGGLYRAVLEVDGRARAEAWIDGNGGRCQDVSPHDSVRQFAFRVPCAPAASATVGLDTTAVPDGRHTVSVYVEDAAGNRATIYGPVTKTVANRPPAPPATTVPGPVPPAPTPSSPHGGRAVVRAWLERGRHRARTATAPYGERVRIRGRITDVHGRPLPGAALSVTEDLVDGYGRRLRPIARVPAPSSLRDVASGRPRWPAVTGVKARRNGRFTMFTRVGPSRQILIRSRGARAPRLVLKVRARVRIVAFHRGLVRGRVGGGYVPRGTFVELQARTGGRWTTRAAVRTRRGGRFAGRLRSLPPGGMARARLRRQPGLPYVASVSPPRIAGRTAARTSR